MGLPRAEQIVRGCDVVHSIDIVPPPTRRPLVVTVHDVLPLTIPEQYEDRQRSMIQRQVALAARHADVVLTTCAATRAAIIENTRIPEDRIVVAPLGHRRARSSSAQRLIDGPYLLAVGSLTPRKGFHTLIEALARMADMNLPLVIAGPDGWRADEIRRTVQRVGIAPQIRILGRVDDETLSGLYEHALALCHPSTAEGFGIPVLEAMAFGTPVVAADIPPVREVTGGHAFLVPPDDVDALVETLSAVVGDEPTRTSHVDAARARSQDYTWAAMAERIRAVYETLS